MRSKQALFLDRDGIFNEVVFYDGEMHSPRNWDEIRHYPGLEALSEIKKLGYQLVMVTNQPDVERGIIDAKFIDSLHEYYRGKYSLDAIYCCPFKSNSHPWKKPNPGMFLQAAQDLSLSLSESFHLGDTVRDVEAARNCGCKSILWDRPYNKECKADYRVSSLAEAQAILQARA
jgi:D-glycero-D-manno-heptose 1,7-bisphosphate phosphatase